MNFGYRHELNNDKNIIDATAYKVLKSKLSHFKKVYMQVKKENFEIGEERGILEKVNKVLKEKIDGLRVRHDDVMTMTLNFCDELKEENKKYKETLKEIRQKVVYHSSDYARDILLMIDKLEK